MQLSFSFFQRTKLLFLNEIDKAEEKIGGALHRERQMFDFRSALDFYGLCDLGYVGSPLHGVITNLTMWLLGSGWTGE